MAAPLPKTPDKVPKLSNYEKLKMELGDDYKIPKLLEPVYKFAGDVMAMMSPVDTETGMPNIDIAGPVMVGKTGARNAQKIVERMKRANAQGADWNSLASNATVFLRHKYPKIYEKIKSLGGDFGVGDINPTNVYGTYYPDRQIAAIFDKGPTRRLADYVNTGAHELGHFIRHLRGKLDESMEFGRTGPVKNLKTGVPEMVEGSYHPATLPQSVLDNITDPARKQEFITKQALRYFDQPAEVAARQAGETGQQAYYNLVRAIFGDYPATHEVMDKLGIPEANRYVNQYGRKP